jgi:hypothetical protein
MRAEFRVELTALDEGGFNFEFVGLADEKLEELLVDLD